MGPQEIGLLVLVGVFFMGALIGFFIGKPGDKGKQKIIDTYLVGKGEFNIEKKEELKQEFKPLPKINEECEVEAVKEAIEEPSTINPPSEVGRTQPH